LLRGPSTSKKLKLFSTGKIGSWILIEPRDCWIGVFWNLDCTHGNVYICLIPMLPLLIRWVRRRRPTKWENDEVRTKSR